MADMEGPGTIQRIGMTPAGPPTLSAVASRAEPHVLKSPGTRGAMNLREPGPSRAGPGGERRRRGQPGARASVHRHSAPRARRKVGPVCDPPADGRAHSPPARDGRPRRPLGLDSGLGGRGNRRLERTVISRPGISRTNDQAGAQPAWRLNATKKRGRFFANRP